MLGMCTLCELARHMIVRSPKYGQDWWDDNKEDAGKLSEALAKHCVEHIFSKRAFGDTPALVLNAAPNIQARGTAAATIERMLTCGDASQPCRCWAPSTT
jgi:hypothetical protein